MSAATYRPIPGTSHGAPHYGERAGEPLTILGPVDPATYDAADVGPMFDAAFADGVRVQVFADEVAAYTDPARVDGVRVTEPPRYGMGVFYGPKLPTRFMLRYAGRERRVYVTSYGNAASVYVIVNGADVYLDTDTEHRLIEAGR